MPVPAVPKEGVALRDICGPELSLRWQNSGASAQSGCSETAEFNPSLTLPRAVSCT